MKWQIFSYCTNFIEKNTFYFFLVSNFILKNQILYLFGITSAFCLLFMYNWSDETALATGRFDITCFWRTPNVNIGAQDLIRFNTVCDRSSVAFYFLCSMTGCAIFPGYFTIMNLEVDKMSMKLLIWSLEANNYDSFALHLIYSISLSHVLKLSSICLLAFAEKWYKLWSSQDKAICTLVQW